MPRIYTCICERLKLAFWHNYTSPLTTWSQHLWASVSPSCIILLCVIGLGAVILNPPELHVFFHSIDEKKAHHQFYGGHAAGHQSKLARNFFWLSCGGTSALWPWIWTWWLLKTVHTHPPMFAWTYIIDTLSERLYMTCSISVAGCWRVQTGSWRSLLDSLLHWSNSFLWCRHTATSTAFGCFVHADCSVSASCIKLVQSWTDVHRSCCAIMHGNVYVSHVPYA